MLKKLSVPIPSFRAILILSLAAYLFISAALNHSDIIASGFSISCFCVFFFFYWLIFTNARNLKKNCKIEFAIDKANSHYSNQPLTILIKFSGLKLAGFVRASGKIKLKQQDLKISEHNINSSSPPSLILAEKIIFPHRGSWVLNSFNLRLQDPLGLFHIPNLEFHNQLILDILPENTAAPNWIAVSSSLKEDERMPHNSQRKGELYDFKAYHPSDGSRRIIWKLFAKSGQLFSRHPEPAYSPEGKVGIFCLAKKNDDYLANQCISFCKRLEEESINIFFSCLSELDNLAKNSSEITVNLLQHAWLSEEATEASVSLIINKLLAELSSNNSRPENICLAISEANLHDKRYQKLILAAQNILNNKSIRINYLISKQASIREINSARTSGIPQRLLNLLFENKVQHHSAEKINSTAFLNKISSSNSEIQWSQ